MAGFAQKAETCPGRWQSQRVEQGGAAGFALSDDFKTSKFGIQWSFHDPKPDTMTRVRYDNGSLLIAAAGRSPADSSPLTCPVGDRSYQAEVTLELSGGAEAGLLLFYNHKAFVGVGFDAENIRTFASAEEQGWMRSKSGTSRLRIRMQNRENVVTFWYSRNDGATWDLHGLRMEVSGIHHNVFGGFLSLKVGIYCAGKGAVRVSDFRYRAVPG